MKISSEVESISLEKKKELETLRESFVASEREKEIELLKKEESISNFKIRLLILSIILIILTLGGGIYYQRTIHEKKRQLAEFEAAKLQQELDLKNQQLTSKTLEMIRKNDLFHRRSLTEPNVMVRRKSNFSTRKTPSESNINNPA